MLLSVCAVQTSDAQVALKSNLLYDAALSPNIGAEVGVAPKWSLEVSGNLNAWTLDNGRRWKHWLVQPEVRYWFCDRFSGHFVGAHLLGGQVNIGGLNHAYNAFWFPTWRLPPPNTLPWTRTRKCWCCLPT